MLKKNAVLFLTGGTVYPAFEVLSRGRTDISMSIAGGVCLCLIDQICHKKMQNCSLAQRCAAGSGIITGIEFLTGVVVNIVLKMNVWDYSAMPGNILGQVCLPYSLLWFFLTIPALGVCAWFEKFIAQNSRLSRKL